MDYAQLRKQLRQVVGDLREHGKNPELPSICQKIGLPNPDEGGSKRDRLHSSFDQVSDHELPKVAALLLEYYCPVAVVRNQVQDLIWADSETPTIEKNVRRAIANAFDTRCEGDLYANATNFSALLKSLFVITEVSPDLTTSLRDDIDQHVFNNPGDWNANELFERLGAYACSAHRFKLFLEGLASESIRNDEADQRRYVTKVNSELIRASLELRETAKVDGYPVFLVTRLGSKSATAPKNLIFASFEKPDLRFHDAINNDIEIVSNADKVLVYDRPIEAAGLRWCDLQNWWADKSGTVGDEARISLYYRLLQSLPPSSPPQQQFFKAYFRAFRQQVRELPALLPEVWLHWDPKTVKMRGTNALTRSRMDFLLLFPYNVRVVVEIDGKQHFADDSGQASPQKYAETMAADRDLKLREYEVFHFGGLELQQDDDSQALVKDFFLRLFKRHGITAASV